MECSRQKDHGEVSVHAFGVGCSAGSTAADFVVSVQSVRFSSRKWGIIQALKQKNDRQNAILIISYDINRREINTGE